MALST
jgi:hypothetical protein